MNNGLQNPVKLVSLDLCQDLELKLPTPHS